MGSLAKVLFVINLATLALPAHAKAGWVAKCVRWLGWSENKISPEVLNVSKQLAHEVHRANGFWPHEFEVGMGIIEDFGDKENSVVVRFQYRGVQVQRPFSLYLWAPSNHLWSDWSPHATDLGRSEGFFLVLHDVQISAPGQEPIHLIDHVLEEFSRLQRRSQLKARLNVKRDLKSGRSVAISVVGDVENRVVQRTLLRLAQAALEKLSQDPTWVR